MFVPPFTLGGLFAFDELAGEKQIQQIESPDGRLTADVYFRGVGAYSGGNGRVDVRIRDRFVPFLERDVCRYDYGLRHLGPPGHGDGSQQPHHDHGLPPVLRLRPEHD